MSTLKARPTYWLRARSTLEISEGTARVRWNKESTKKVAEQIKEKQQQAESSGISWVREQDVLTSYLGLEQPGRVRGMSRYMG